MFHLTLQQLQVVNALSGGPTLTGATAQAGIHRNPIANWRSSDDFRAASAMAHRERAVELADLALHPRCHLHHRKGFHPAQVRKRKAR